MLIVISTILCGISYLVLYLIMPNTNILMYFCLAIIIPTIVNIILYKIFNGYNKNYKYILITSVVSGIEYAFCSYAIKHADKIEQFIRLNEFNNEIITINIDENIGSIPHIVFVILVQMCILFLVRHIYLRRKSDD